MRSVFTITVVGLLLLGVPSAMAEPPANDDFLDAEPLAGLPTTVSGTTRGASPENGGPGVPDVWYRLTAPVNGPLELQVGNAYRKRSAYLYAGDSRETLERIAMTEERDLLAPHSFHFRTSEPLVAGAEYRIRIAGVDRFVLAVRRAVPGATANARQRRNRLDLRIPVRLQADVKAQVELEGEIYIRTHSDRQRVKVDLAPASVSVRAGQTSVALMRLKRPGRDRACRTLLYALSLRDIRSHSAYGRAVFQTDDGEHSVLPWEAIVDELTAGDRSAIRHGRGRC